MKKYILLVLAIMLASCKPSEAVIQQAIFQTQTAEIKPTETTTPIPTKIPIEDLNFTEIAFLPYDLPIGYAPAQIVGRGKFPDKIEDLPINKYVQQISYDNGESGKIEYGGLLAIYIFETANDAQSAYDYFMGANIDGLGDSSMNREEGSLIFLRCKVIVYIELVGPDSTGAIDYAKHLDSRLIDLVCE